MPGSQEIVTVLQSQAITTTLTSAEPGPAGPPGVGSANLSAQPDNRLRNEADGMYVPECAADPLAYYILASN